MDTCGGRAKIFASRRVLALSRLGVSGGLRRHISALGEGQHGFQIDADLQIGRRKLGRLLQLELGVIEASQPVESAAEIIEEPDIRRLDACGPFEIDRGESPIFPCRRYPAEAVTAKAR